MKKYALWIGIGLLSTLIIAGLSLEQTPVTSLTNDQNISLTEKRRSAVLTYFINRDLERMGLGEGQDYWVAFFIQEGVQDFPWIKGKILNQLGEVIGGVTFVYQYHSSSVNPSVVNVMVNIRPSSIDELLTSGSHFGLLVKKHGGDGKSSAAGVNLLATADETQFEVEYQVAEARVEANATELAEYFEHTHPTILAATNSLFKHRLRDMMMEARFELGSDEGAHIERRYLIGCDDPDQHFLGSVRAGPGGKTLLAVRPLMEDYTPELGLKFWQFQWSGTADVALEDFLEIEPESGISLDSRTGEIILEVQVK